MLLGTVWCGEAEAPRFKFAWQLGQLAVLRHEVLDRLRVHEQSITSVFSNSRDALCQSLGKHAGTGHLHHGPHPLQAGIRGFLKMGRGRGNG